LSPRRIPPAGILALGLFFVLAGAVSAADDADEAVLRRLNDDYVRAFLASDVARYRELLADDFYGVLADGRVIDKAAFLAQAAQPPALRDFRVREVVVRLYGDAALVNTRATYLRPDGTPAQTRYVHVYVRRGGRWQIASVQITRLAAP
jgi:ketosteroid isomerase-like protein